MSEVRIDFTREQHGPAVFRTMWLEGEDDDGNTFELTAGAGVGNPYMILTVRAADGRQVVEVADIRKAISTRVGQILAETAAPAAETAPEVAR